MSWCRLEDDMDDNRKLLRLSDAAFRLYWIAIPWCRRHRTGGRLYEADVVGLCAKSRLQDPAALIAELLEVPYDYEVGCWARVRRGVFEIHDFDAYNPPSSTERMARKRARDRDEADSVNPASTERPVTSDADEPGNVTGRDAHGVTLPVTSDADEPGNVTKRGASVTGRDMNVTGPRARARVRVSDPDPVPEPVPVPEPRRRPPLPPQAGAVTPLPPSPEVAERAQALEDGCLEILAARPLKALERDLVLGWAATLRCDGELVPVEEVLAVARLKMATPTSDGSLPANLAWCADDVAALARSRAGAPIEHWGRAPRGSTTPATEQARRLERWAAEAEARGEQ